MRHFLTLLDVSADEARFILKRAAKIKRKLKEGKPHRPLEGKTLAMIFDKSSTRTRVAFETGMYQLGGHALFLHSDATQLGRGETIADSARVLSSMVDGITIRTFGHDILQKFAEHSKVPVINALTDLTHPCQILADVLTYEEHRGPIEGKTVAWIGDGNNMANSWLDAACRLGFRLSLACPKGYEPDNEILSRAQAEAEKPITLCEDPREAIKGADVINADVWASMGQEDEAAARLKVFQPYQVNSELLQAADPEAIVLHCLPAHRGEEITEEVLEGPQCVAFDQAENKMHIHKAILEGLLT
jgi:ornithine carbamoyltransferase